jgi:hypothetical protein
MLAAAVHEQEAERPAGFLGGAGKVIPLPVVRSAHEPPGPVPPHRIVCFRRDGKAGTHKRPGSDLPPEETPHHLAVESPPGSVELLEGVAAPKRFRLPHLPFVADGKLLPAARAPAGENLPPGLRRHAGAEPVRVLPLPFVWLKRDAHPDLPLDVLDCRSQPTRLHEATSLAGLQGIKNMPQTQENGGEKEILGLRRPHHCSIIMK